MITPDRLKAFLDDLALIGSKHGVFVVGGTARAYEGQMRGYVATQNCFGDQVLNTWDVSPVHISVSLSEIEDTPVSFDITTITAHQRIALERSLADVRRQAEGLD